MSVSATILQTAPLFRQKFDTFDEAWDWCCKTVAQARADGWQVRAAEIRMEMDFESGEPVIMAFVRCMGTK